MIKTLSIVGAGRLGRTLGRCLRELGWKIGILPGRTLARARKSTQIIGVGRAHVGITAELAASGTILLTVPDDAIAIVAHELACVGGESLRGSIVLNSSGALDAGALAAVRNCVAHAGSMHPLRTFSGVNYPPLERRVFTIEGDDKPVKFARCIARELGGILYNVSKKKKVICHAAGAFASGPGGARRDLMNTGMRRNEPVRVLVPLTRQVLENYEKLGAQKARTGPRSRGDYGVVSVHEDAFAKYQLEFLETCRVLCRQAARVLSSNREVVLGELDKISANLRFSIRAKGESA